MATIEMEKKHNLGKDVARQRAEDLAVKLKEKMSLDWRWNGDVIDFDAKTGSAKGTKGKVIVSDTSLRVEVDLPFLLRPLKGMVESKIQEKLDSIVPS